jgi:hypothetical protein
MYITVGYYGEGSPRVSFNPTADGAIDSSVRFSQMGMSVAVFFVDESGESRVVNGKDLRNE